MNLEQITGASAAHSLWKSRLTFAGQAGRIDQPIETIRSDCQCDFGKWLNSTELSAADKSARNQEVKALHTSFHKVAADVATVATKGQAQQRLILLPPWVHSQRHQANWWKHL